VEAADKQISDLFLTDPRNASYLSWRVQNHIISLMGDAIQKQILSDISQCKYFSILTDETTDVSSGVRRKFSWGGFGSGSCGGHLYLVCTVCDVTI